MKIQASPETLKLLAKTKAGFSARVLSISKNKTVVIETDDGGAHVLAKTEIEDLGKLSSGDVLNFAESGEAKLQEQEKKAAGRPRGSGCSYAQLTNRTMA